MQDLRATVSRLNNDIVNISDMKSQHNDLQRNVHDEKVRYGELNNTRVRIIHDFEVKIDEKNREIVSFKEQLGKTITQLTNAENKIRDLEITLNHSKDSLGKASIDISRLSGNLNDENVRYSKLLEETRKERNVFKIS